MLKTLFIIIGVVIVETLMELILTYLMRTKGKMPFKLKLSPDFELPTVMA